MPAPNKPNNTAATATAAAKKNAARLERNAAELHSAGYVVWSPEKVTAILSEDMNGKRFGHFMWGYLGWPGAYVLPGGCPNAVRPVPPPHLTPYNYTGDHDHAACLRKIRDGGTLT